MKRILVFCAMLSLLLFFSSILVYAQELDKALAYRIVRKVLPFEKLELAGFLKNETSLRMAGLDEFMKIANIAQLKGNYKIRDGVEFFTILHWFYDAVYEVEDNIYRDVSFKEKNRKLRFPEKMQWLRECYLDIYTDLLDIRAGKQQVVWGTADGVRILDIVNPLDYREWTLKNYVDIRMPLWMVNLEAEVIPDGHLQFLIIPDYAPNYYAPAGAPFALRTVELGAIKQPGITVSTIAEKPEHTFENTKLGLRWRHVIGKGFAQGLEYTLNYLHTYDFASSAYTDFVYPTAFITRRAEQIEVLGGTFSKSITRGLLGIPGLAKGWTLRGEFAWLHNGAMNYGTDSKIEGTTDVDQYNYVLGFDKVYWTNWLLSFQLIQLHAHSRGGDFNRTLYTLLNGATRGPLDKTETMLTCKISTDFMHDRLKPEVLILYGDDNDWRISPKVNFEINDRWQITGGVHIFEGKGEHLSGQFDKNDQIFFETKYTF